MMTPLYRHRPGSTSEGPTRCTATVNPEQTSFSLFIVLHTYIHVYIYCGVKPVRVLAMAIGFYGMTDFGCSRKCKLRNWESECCAVIRSASTQQSLSAINISRNNSSGQSGGPRQLLGVLWFSSISQPYICLEKKTLWITGPDTLTSFLLCLN